jgi:hypothetical protein
MRAGPRPSDGTVWRWRFGSGAAAANGGEVRGGRWRRRSCPTSPWSQGGGERRPKMEAHQVVVELTREKEDGGTWVRNQLRDSEIRRSGCPNGGGGFQGVSPECFGVEGGARG